jgi:hypothetical protein
MERFAEAVTRFRAAHDEDPARRALRYHQCVAHWIERLDPEASEPLKLAAHCQHIRRWTLPRDRFPAGRAGYRRWRSTLARFHADEAERILADVGYDQTIIERVRTLLLKKGLGVDAEVQTLEDAVCLTFLEIDLADFSAKHADDKLIDILQKTWRKMSPGGHAAALALTGDLPEKLRTLIQRAVDG